jgi:hypothetical protein
MSALAKAGLCVVCERWIDEHRLGDARECVEVLVSQAEELIERTCGGATPTAIARTARMALARA